MSQEAPWPIVLTFLLPDGETVRCSTSSFPASSARSRFCTVDVETAKLLGYVRLGAV